MSKARIVVVGDPHFIRNPTSRKDYPYELEQLWLQVGKIARQVKADRVACTADWFHSKNNARVGDVALAARCIHPIAESFGSILSGEGNHDVSVTSEDRPVSALIEAGLVETAVRGLLTLTSQSGLTYEVRAMSFNEKPNLSSWYTRTSSDPLLLLTHADFTSFNVLRVKARSPIAVINGHLHDKQFVTQSAPNHVFACVGVMGRVSIAERNITPNVAVVTLTPTTATVRLIPLSLESNEHDTGSMNQWVDAPAHDAAVDSDIMTEFVRWLSLEQSATGNIDIVAAVQSAGRSAKINPRVMKQAIRIVREAV